jgi:ribosome assembly protein YihI (activator of Der GTPase)
MIPDFHSDDFLLARPNDTASLRSAAREARATLYNVMERLEAGDTDGEEQPFIDDCLGAIAILEVALL